MTAEAAICGEDGRLDRHDHPWCAIDAGRIRIPLRANRSSKPLRGMARRRAILPANSSGEDPHVPFDKHQGHRKGI